MKKQITAGLLSFGVTIAILTGLTYGYRSLTKTNTPAPPSSASTETSPDKNEFCSIVTTGALREITGISYKKPMETKSVVSTGLSSQTCIYAAPKSADNIQIVLKYQTDQNSTPSIEENWDQLKDQNKDNFLKSEVSPEAFVTLNTLYVFTNRQIISITGNLKLPIQEQIAKKLL